MKKERITKRIENSDIYLIWEIFSLIWENSYCESRFSNELKNKYSEFMDCLYTELELLKCDEITNEYIVIEGYNYI